MQSVIKPILIGLALALALTLTLAQAQDPTSNQIFNNDRPVLYEVGLGIESQKLNLSGYDSSLKNLVQKTDGSRSGVRFILRYQELSIPWLKNNLAQGTVVFLPMYFVFDSNAQPSGFGRVDQIQSDRTVVRKAVGALIEATAESTQYPHGLSTKLAQLEFDRDKGWWSWRFIETKFKFKPINNQHTSLELYVGGAVDQTAAVGFESLELLLSQQATAKNVRTFNPLIGLTSKTNLPFFTLTAQVNFEKRLLLSADQPALFNSEHVVLKLDQEYHLSENAQASGKGFSFFSSLSYEYDNLTLGRVVFGLKDAFESWLMIIGLRLHL